MKKHRDLYISLSLMAAFVLWTVCVCFVDVQAIGPCESSVGLSAVNLFVHKLTGVHMFLYYVTDWLSLVPIFIVLGFALLGVFQWIKRKELCKVDFNILVLGVFYFALVTLYILFEAVTVNYRPILIDGALETSYPSSTTLLVIGVMFTAKMQFNGRIKNSALKASVSFLITAFTIFMVAGRLLSGVHWFTDIVGGSLLG
ncbi:MAG: phosphatase PAP2 family protein, partial [Clostridia bacterium]|nr:phosphatase PAP2 family protein [Clostridia bacterium]